MSLVMALAGPASETAHGWLSEARAAFACAGSGTAGLFSLSLAAAALVGELGLAEGGGANEAEEGPAVASSAVIRLLRKRSMGVLGTC